jgi:hypothetical protein
LHVKVKDPQQMKTLNIFLALFLVTTAAKAETQKQILNCENKIYRDAALIIDDNTVVIRDMPVGYHKLARAMEKLMGFQEETLIIMNAQLTALKGIDCNSPITILNSCRLVQEQVVASLTVDVMIHANGVLGKAKLHQKVNLNKFQVRTNLESAQQGIQLGNSVNQVTLDTVNVVAEANVLVGEEQVLLNFETPYWIAAKNSKDSFCRLK